MNNHFGKVLFFLPFTLASGQALAQDAISPLEGSWLVVQCQDNGQVDRSPLGDHFMIEGSSLAIHIQDAGIIQCTYRLDDQSSPAQIDLIIGSESEEMVSEGIYRLEDQTLTLCLAPPGGPRPDAFETEAGDNRRLILFEQEEPIEQEGEEESDGE